MRRALLNGPITKALNFMFGFNSDFRIAMESKRPVLSRRLLEENRSYRLITFAHGFRQKPLHSIAICQLAAPRKVQERSVTGRR